MKIYYARGEHKYTIILLHGLYCDYTWFETLVNRLKQVSNNIKIIIPNAPVRVIDWPSGKEKDIRSWYNYFTCRDGELQHDDIDIDHYKSQCKRVEDIIVRELHTITSQNIVLIGESQGGTIVSGLSLQLKHQLGGYILLDSVFMDNIIIPSTIYKNIYIYSSENDEIYTISLQKDSVKRLQIEDYIVEWYIEKGVTHGEYGPNRDKFVISKIQNIFSI